MGWYDSIDRLRVGGILRPLQQAGSVVNCMKLYYPGDERPLRHFPALTQRLTVCVMKLVRQRVPSIEAARASDPTVQAWLEPLYAGGPGACSALAIVRAIEGVSSVSCQPRNHRAAKGHPKTGQRTAATAEHHLTNAQHNISVYYFSVYNAHWGRDSVRLGSSLLFEVSLQLNGHEYLERQMWRRRRQITMAGNAVDKVADWAALRGLAGADLEPAVRRFGAYWLAPLPHGLTPTQLGLLGGYSWYLQTRAVRHNFVFRSEDECRPLFETPPPHPVAGEPRHHPLPLRAGPGAPPADEQPGDPRDPDGLLQGLLRKPLAEVLRQAGRHPPV